MKGTLADSAPKSISRDDQRNRMNTAELLWGVLFSSIGLGFFIYGRRQNKLIPLLSGVALMIVPYFMPNTAALVIVGLIFIAVPYFVRR